MDKDAPSSRTTMPVTGLGAVDVMDRMREGKLADAAWRRGRTFSLVYPTGRDDVDKLLTDANLAYLFENALNPLRFPRSREDGARRHRHGRVAPSRTCRGRRKTHVRGDRVDRAVRAGRPGARAERGLDRGNVVFPVSAHPAFAKGAHLTGLSTQATSLRADFTADPDDMAGAIDDETVLVVGSAYGYPHGVVDPIEELSELARKRDIPFHTDTCIGGFVLPF